MGQIETLQGKAYRSDDYIETAITTKDFAAVMFAMGKPRVVH